MPAYTDLKVFSVNLNEMYLKHLINAVFFNQTLKIFRDVEEIMSTNIELTVNITAVLH